MEFIQDITKFKHKVFGIGTYRGKHNIDSMIVEFDSGKKVIAFKAFDMGLIKELKSVEYKPVIISDSSDTSKMDIKFVDGDKIQYDSSETKLGGYNLLESFSCDKELVFNESYIIMGSRMKASVIFASYDLTIIGDLEVERIHTNGKLTVYGDLKSKEIVCLKDLICAGTIITDTIDVTGDIIAANINSKKLTCGKNVLVQSTIDIEDTSIDKVLVAAEGIVGAGELSVKNAIAVEYFEYDGDIKGKVFELDTDSEFGVERAITQEEPNDLTFEMLMKKLPTLINQEVIKAGQVDENNILNFFKDFTKDDIFGAYEWFDVFSYLIDISYEDTLTNFKDYLFLLYAQEVLPDAALNYESVEHVFGSFFQDAKDKVQELTYKAKNINEFILSIKIILLLEEKLLIEKEDALDKVFQSIGIKYRTVKQFLSK